jgi:hypothetical protein
MDVSGQELTNEMTPVSETTPETKQVSVFDLEVKTENQALNVLVAFLDLAQRRGAFNMQESAKIWESVQMFTKKSEDVNVEEVKSD